MGEPGGAGTPSFTDFLERMRAPEAADLVRAIKGFIQEFQTAAPDPDQDAKRVQGFLEAAEATFRGHVVWRGASEAELEAAGEFMEKYLLTKLHPRIFGVYLPDRERDEVLAERMAALGRFVEPRHLDIPERAHHADAWALAEEELRKVNAYKAPRDKIICVLNCCRIINNALATAAQSSEAAGADDFLPVLIYVTIRAAPELLESNLQYIQRFRRTPRLSGEGAYFFTNLVSASSFVETITADSLSMDPEAFRARMWEAGVPGAEPAGASSAKSDASSSGGGRPTLMVLPAGQAPNAAPIAGPGPGPCSGPPTGPPSEARRRGATLIGAASRRLPELFELEGEGMVAVAAAGRLSGALAAKHPFFHAAVGDLTVSDVEALLEAYKEAVLRYEALAGGYAVLLREVSGGYRQTERGVAPPLRRGDANSEVEGVEGSPSSPASAGMESGRAAAAGEGGRGVLGDCVVSGNGGGACANTGVVGTHKSAGTDEGLHESDQSLLETVVRVAPGGSPQPPLAQPPPPTAQQPAPVAHPQLPVGGSLI